MPILLDEPAAVQIDAGEPAPPTDHDLPTWLFIQATYYDSLMSPVGTWLAGRLRALAESACFLGATTPAEHDGREAVAIADREAELLARGYDRAMGEEFPRAAFDWS